MFVFNNYIYKNKKSKLCFRDHVVVLNDFFYQTGWNILNNMTILKTALQFPISYASSLYLSDARLPIFT
jgi:hypothetical protein